MGLNFLKIIGLKNHITLHHNDKRGKGGEEAQSFVLKRIGEFASGFNHN
jgi:hypothetical protein